LHHLPFFVKKDLYHTLIVLFILRGAWADWKWEVISVRAKFIIRD